MSRIMTVIGLMALVLLVACSTAPPTKPSLHYTIGGCEEEIEPTRSDTGGEVEISAEDGIIHVEQRLTYVCCAGLSLTLEQEKSTVKVIETNVGEICRCICEYRIEASISDLAPGTYQVQVWGVEYEDVHPLELLGEATVTL